MARFGRMFEVKGEMQDIKEIVPDDKKTGGKTSKVIDEELDNEGNKVGFDDVDIEDVLDEKEPEIEKPISEEFKAKNAIVESEINQYYNYDISDKDMQAYITSKIAEIYGEQLQHYNLASASEMVEAFMQSNEFDGVGSYRDLTQSIEETISIMRTNEQKSHNKTAEKSTSKTEEKTTEVKGIEALSEEETKKMVSAYKSMSNQGELSANAYISSQAKKIGIDKKELTTFIQEKGKEEISSPDKVLHYHRTSMESFKKIMETGYLLNRKNMQLNGIDTSSLKGSSSANIQFSRDVYDEAGELQSSGFDIENNLGASSADVVFVMSPELMKEDTYNCLGMYPTVEKADIQQCCATILAKDPEIQMQIESILKNKNIPIKTILQDEFSRDTVLQEINKTDIEKEPEETGAILHSANGQVINREETGAVLKSVNGRDILSSAIQATEETTRTDSINDQRNKIVQLQKERTQTLENKDMSRD